MRVHFFAHLFLLSLLACNNSAPTTTSGSVSFPSTGPDPLDEYMWHLKDTDSPYVNGQTSSNGENINLGSVHSTATGKGVKVVVSDGRVAMDHPEVKANANLTLSKDYRVASPYHGYPSSDDNYDSHGTAIAGLALGVQNNGVGGYGVAPEATLIGYNYLSNSQSASQTLDQAELVGFSGIFNYSYGYDTCMVNAESFLDIYADKLRSGSVGHNHIYVTAAGNDFSGTLENCNGDPSVTYYGNANFDQAKTYPYQIVVGATSAIGKSTDYSTPGSNVWVSAPGGDDRIGLMIADLVGCSKGYTSYGSLPFDLKNSTLNPYCSFFSLGMGTSFATPLVVGSIAVLREINPDFTWRDIKYILASTARKIDQTASTTNHPNNENLSAHDYQLGWQTNGASFSFHPWYGFGQVDLTAAVAMAQSFNVELHELKTTDTMEDLASYTSGNINLNIPDFSATGISSSISVSKHNLMIEHVRVEVNITHSKPSDIGIELTSPGGMTTRLTNINSHMMGSNLTNVHFGANAFYGERSKGSWTLKVVDGSAGTVGRLVSWKLSILGSRGADLVDTTAPAAPSNLRISGSSLIWTASASGDLARYELCIRPVSAGETGCSDTDWRHINPGVTSLVIGKYFLNGATGLMVSGQSYTAKIRAIDTSENESTVVDINAPWTHQ